MKRASNIVWIAAVTGLLACGGDGGTKGGKIATLEAFDDGLTLSINGTIGVSGAAISPWRTSASSACERSRRCRASISW
jgi:hypothetical protein